MTYRCPSCQKVFEVVPRPSKAPWLCPYCGAGYPEADSLRKEQG